VAVLDKRVPARRAETPAEGGKFGGAEVLVAEHQHRMLGESVRDPGEGRLVERARQVDAERLGTQRLAQRVELWCVCHALSSRVVACQGIITPMRPRRQSARPFKALPAARPCCLL